MVFINASEVGVLLSAGQHHLVLAEMVNQRLHVSEDTLGVWFLTHYHHVLNLQQGHAISMGPFALSFDPRRSFWF